MLKRKDLAKEFELVVKQEIINHNEAVSASNQRVNELEDKINVINVRIDELSAYCKNYISQSEISLNRLSNSINETSKKVNYYINDVSVSFKNIKKDLEIAFNNSVDSNNRNQRIKIEIESIDQQIKDVLDHVINMESKLECVENDYVQHVRQEIEVCKNDILKRPSEAKKVKCELESKMEIDRVDFNSVMKELQAVKKKAFIQEKYIEKIMNDLEKMKNEAKK